MCQTWMLRSLRLVFLLMVFVSFGSLTARAAEPEMLMGEISRLDLQVRPYNSWFQKNYTAYNPDAKVTENLAALLKDVQVTIVLGTWCPDSMRQVPRFYKILDQIGVSGALINMVAVDMKLTAPDYDVAALGITNTPTYIFSRGDREINRIVETPVHSLEQDMVAILTGQDYRHMKYEAR